jgi:hypothetical protein
VAASFPTSIKVFSAKADGEVIYAAHVNELQEEIVAIENELGSDPSGASFSTVKARIADLETGKLNTADIGTINHNSLANLTTGDPHTQYVTKAIATTKGDLLAATGAGALARLAAGTNGHVLTADSTAGTGLKWEAPATPSDGTSTLTTKGDLLTRTTSGLARQAVGSSDGQPLVAAPGVANGMRWGGEVNLYGQRFRRASLIDYTESGTVYISPSGTLALNASTDSVVRCNALAANVTFTLTKSTQASTTEFCTITLILQMGSTLRSVTWPSTVKWPGGTAPTFAASTTNLLTFIYDQTSDTWLAGSPLLDIK